MTPKNPEAYSRKLKSLIAEIDGIINNEVLTKDYKNLSLKKNELRSKIIPFLSISFENSDNEYKTEFEDNFHEVSQLHMYMSDNSLPREPIFRHELEQFDFAKSLLLKYISVAEFLTEVVNDLPSERTDEGLFFKGQYYDAIFKLSNLITAAKNEIKLVDNYINVDLINFLSSKHTNVDLKIISTNNNISQIRLTLVGFQRQLNKIEIREDNSYHDRFLIIDDTDFYHFGASLKDLGNKTFMFSKINETSIQKAIKTDFDNSWQNGTVLFS